MSQCPTIGARVLYRAIIQPGQPPALFSVPLAGPSSASIRLANTFTGTGVGANIRISPNGRKVVYRTDEQDRLRVVPIDGPASAGGRLTRPFATQGRIREFQISDDSQSVVEQRTRTRHCSTSCTGCR